jgi:hypothetical protein
MFQPGRLRTFNPSTVETRARKPSHFTSYAQPGPLGSGPGLASMGDVGSRIPATDYRGIRLDAVAVFPAIRWMLVRSSWNG